MNLLDVVIAVVFLWCVYGSYRRGFASAVFGFVSFWVSAMLAGVLRPYASAWLGSTGLYGWVYGRVEAALFGGGAAANTRMEGAALIQGLELPGLVRRVLMANDNAAAYGALGVSAAEGYVAAFVTGAVMNVIAMGLVFAALYAAMRAIGAALHVVSHLPLLGTVNRLFGAALGAAVGLALALAITAAAAWLGAAGVGAAWGLAELARDSYFAKLFEGLTWWPDILPIKI